MGRLDRPRARRIWQPLAAAHESHANLPQNEKPAGGAAAAGSYKLENTVRYLGVEIDDALELAEQTDI